MLPISPPLSQSHLRLCPSIWWSQNIGRVFWQRYRERELESNNRESFFLTKLEIILAKGGSDFTNSIWTKKVFWQSKWLFAKKVFWQSKWLFAWKVALPCLAPPWTPQKTIDSPEQWVVVFECYLNELLKRQSTLMGETFINSEPFGRLQIYLVGTIWYLTNVLSIGLVLLDVQISKTQNKGKFWGIFIYEKKI